MVNVIQKWLMLRRINKAIKKFGAEAKQKDGGLIITFELHNIETFIPKELITQEYLSVVIYEVFEAYKCENMSKGTRRFN